MYYSTNDGSSWTLVTNGLSTLTYSFDASAVPHGSDMLIKVVADNEIGFKGEWISDSSYLIANVPHELSALSFMTPVSGESLSGIVTISWSEVTDSWGHGGIFYNLHYFKGLGNIDSAWEVFAGSLEVTSYQWDTATFENGEYSLSIEVFSDGLGEFVMLDGVVTILNPTETSSVKSTTPNQDDSFVPFNSFNIAIISVITTIVVGRKRNSKFN